MEVQLSPKAVKEFKDLSKSVQERFLKAFARLENDPFNLSRELRTKKLTAGRFGLRIDKYRAIYKVAKELIMVTVIRHRKDAYKNLLRKGLSAAHGGCGGTFRLS